MIAYCNCGGKFRVKPHHIGQTFKCPYCEQEFVVYEAPEEDELDQAQAKDVQRAGETLEGERGDNTPQFAETTESVEKDSSPGVSLAKEKDEETSGSGEWAASPSPEATLTDGESEKSDTASISSGWEAIKAKGQSSDSIPQTETALEETSSISAPPLEVTAIEPPQEDILPPPSPFTNAAPTESPMDPAEMGGSLGDNEPKDTDEISQPGSLAGQNKPVLEKAIETEEKAVNTEEKAIDTEEKAIDKEEKAYVSEPSAVKEDIGQQEKEEERPSLEEKTNLFRYESSEPETKESTPENIPLSVAPLSPQLEPASPPGYSDSNPLNISESDEKVGEDKTISVENIEPAPLFPSDESSILAPPPPLDSFVEKDEAEYQSAPPPPLPIPLPLPNPVGTEAQGVAPPPPAPWTPQPPPGTPERDHTVHPPLIIQEQSPIQPPTQAPNSGGVRPIPPVKPLPKKEPKDEDIEAGKYVMFFGENFCYLILGFIVFIGLLKVETINSWAESYDMVFPISALIICYIILIFLVWGINTIITKLTSVQKLLKEQNELLKKKKED